MMGKRFCANTVPGKQRGEKYDEVTKTEVLTALLCSSNIHKVAKKYKIPESTIRGWQKAAQKPGKNGEKSDWQIAREDAIRDLSVKAAMGALLTVDNIQRRMILDEGKAEEHDRLLRQRAAAQAAKEKATAAGDTVHKMEMETKIAVLDAKISAVRPMNDFASANYLRALTAVAAKAGELTGGEKAAPQMLEAMLAAVAGDEY